MLPHFRAPKSRINVFCEIGVMAKNFNIGRVIVLAMLTGVMASCSDIHFTMEGYKRAVRSGLAMIPEASQVEDTFGDSDHFISYSGSRELGNTWNTEVFFYGRYVLTMQVKVRMGYSFDKVLEVLGEPQFFLSEVDYVEFDENGQIGVRYKTDGPVSTIPYPFSLAKWKKVYAANGDFSVIGCKLDKDHPVPHFSDYVYAIRRDRILPE